MKLYLHVGTEKTGSSYVQSMAAINREKLLEEGIWFPVAGKLEPQLQQGEISAGNAQALTNALEAGDTNEVKALLQQYLRLAKKKHCQAVVLSNELLALALSKDENLPTLEVIASEVGYHVISCLLILRDPVEQALSLYKHRAKGGTAPPIEEWPDEHFRYGNGLFNFLKIIQDSNMHLTCRKYNRQSGHLEQVFFKNWLGLKTDLEQPTKAVNPSLSISELFLIKKLKMLDRWLPQFLYERLLDIPKDQKAEEPRIVAYYRSVLAKHLILFEDTWKLCNRYLPEGEALDLPKSKEADIIGEEKVMTLSEKQSEVLAAFMQEASTSRFKWQWRVKKWRRQLGNMRRKRLG